MKRFVLSTLILCVAMLLQAASFHTEKLAAIAKATRLNIPDSLGADMDNDTTWIYRNRPLRLRTNKWGEVSHIGYKLFDRNMIATYANTVVFDFIERYALETDLRIDGLTTAVRLDKDGVIVEKGNINMLQYITPQTPLSVDNLSRRMYCMTWTTANGELKISFPADYQLMIGANLIELEEMALRNLPRTEIIVTATIPDTLLENYETHKSKNKVFILERGNYLNSLIRADLTLIGSKGKMQLLCNKRNTSASISNIMLTGVFPRLLPVNLTIECYGNKKKKMDISLQQIIKFCQDECCTLYFGIKEIENGVLSGTLFAVNEIGAYDNMFSVEVPLTILNGDENAVIDATAYLYIPLQNVTESFFNQNLQSYHEE